MDTWRECEHCGMKYEAELARSEHSFYGAINSTMTCYGTATVSELILEDRILLGSLG